jgi:hypothetical protein
MGMIVLGAATAATKPAGAPTQTVKVSGTLSAAGKKKDATGGTIQVTGERPTPANITPPYPTGSIYTQNYRVNRPATDLCN